MNDTEIWLIPYMDVFEGFFSSSIYLKVLFFVMVAIWLILLFYYLFHISDENFVKALQMLTKSLKMSPDLAGLTLLSLGNGAPEFFTALFGVGQSPELVFGGIVGSGFFVTTVVLGLIIIFGKKSSFNREYVYNSCKPTDDPESGRNQTSNLNDSRQHDHRQGNSTLMICNASNVDGNQINLVGKSYKPIKMESSPGDIIKSSRIESLDGPRDDDQFENISDGENAKASFIIDNSTRKNADTLNDEESGLRLFENYIQLNKYLFLRGSIMLLLCYSMMLGLTFMKKLPMWLCICLVVFYVFYIFLSITMNFARPSNLENLEAESNLDKPRENSPDFINMSMQDLTMAVKARPFMILKMMKALIFLPISLTVLPMNYDDLGTIATQKIRHTYRLNRLRCVLNPFFSIPAYVVIISQSWWTEYYFMWGVYLLVALSLASIFYITTSDVEKPRFFGIHVFYTFCTCLLWMYLVCNELISCLSAVGSILRIQSSTMGVLVLAIGNSFGDLAANLNIARRGNLDMSLSAVFTAPIQNILLTMGVSFAIATAKQPGRCIELSLLTKTIITPIVINMYAIILCILVGSLVSDCKVPRIFGLILIGIFVVQVPFVVLFGFL